MSLSNKRQRPGSLRSASDFARCVPRRRLWMDYLAPYRESSRTPPQNSSGEILAARAGLTSEVPSAVATLLSLERLPLAPAPASTSMEAPLNRLDPSYEVSLRDESLE